MTIATRRRLAATALPLVVLSAGCGGSSGGDADDTRARTVTAPSSAGEDSAAGGGQRTLSAAELKRALLTVTDLPTGYKVDTSPQRDDRDDSSGENAECTQKFEALSGQNTDKGSAQAKAKFEGPSFGTILQEDLSSFKEENGLSDRFDALAEVLSSCPRFTSTDSKGTRTAYTVGALSFPKLGDDTLALAINVKTTDFGRAINIAAVRLGKNVMFVTQGGLTADAAVLEQAARKGVAKLAKVSK